MSSLESQFYGLHIAYQEALWGAAAIINFELRVLPPKICPRHGIWGRVRGRAPRGFYEPASHIHPEPSNNNFGCENIADAPPGHRWDAFDRATSEPPLSAVFRHSLVAIYRVRPDEGLAAFTRLYPGEYLRVKACAKSGWSVQRNRVALDHKGATEAPPVTDSGITVTISHTTFRPRQIQRQTDMERIARTMGSLKSSSMYLELQYSVIRSAMVTANAVAKFSVVVL